MKKKHYRPAILIVALLVFISTIVYGIISMNATKETTHYKLPGPLPKITAVNNINNVKINKLLKEIASLAQPKQEIGLSSPLGFSLFSNFKPALSDDLGPNRDDENTGYHLSFAFFSENKRFCVLNGKFYSEGSLLPDGTQIKIIEAERVMISKNKIKKWLEVTGPRKKRKKN